MNNDKLKWVKPEVEIYNLDTIQAGVNASFGEFVSANASNKLGS